MGAGPSVDPNGQPVAPGTIAPSKPHAKQTKPRRPGSKVNETRLTSVNPVETAPNEGLFGRPAAKPPNDSKMLVSGDRGKPSLPLSKSPLLVDLTPVKAEDKMPLTSIRPVSPATPATPAPDLVAHAGPVVPFRQMMRTCVEQARVQRSAAGKFRRDERQMCMELYNLMGLDEDEFLAPPNELQTTLRAFHFPPPNMFMLREQNVDEETMEFMLGADEAKRRKDHGFKVESTSLKPLADQDSKRRAGVSSEATKTMDRMKVFKTIPKTKMQAARLNSCMQRSILFKNLDARDLKILFDAFEQESFAAEQVIFEKGDEGDRFYLIDEGRCQVFIPDKTEPDKALSLFIGEGDTFGELGVMYGTPRAATVTAVIDSVLWWIDRDTYRGTLLNQTMRKRDRYMKFLDSVPMFQSIDQYEKARMADVLEVTEFKQGDLIVCEGDSGDTFYLIEEGEVRVETTGQGVVNRLSSGMWFGEMALLYDQPRLASVIAVSPIVRVVSLNRQHFQNYLGPFEEILRRNAEQYKQFLRKMKTTTA